MSAVWADYPQHEVKQDSESLEPIFLKNYL